MEAKTVDSGDPAWQLAEAAFAVVRGDPHALERAIKTLKPTTATIAKAYGLCLTTAPFCGTEATRLLLSTVPYARG
jgi:hypothetical protein